MKNDNEPPFFLMINLVPRLLANMCCCSEYLLKTFLCLYIHSTLQLQSYSVQLQNSVIQSFCVFIFKYYKIIHFHNNLTTQ